MVKPIFKMTAQIKKAAYAKFIIEPLVKGSGYTLGNALRRVLLSSLEGYAITHMEINNVRHQFTTIEGMKEDVIHFKLNLKRVRIKSAIETPATIYLDVKGPKTVTAADLQPEAGLEIVNKDQVLCHLTTTKARLKAKFTVNKGYRFVLSDELDKPHLGVIPIDAFFSPVIKVNYKVEATRVGRETDWDKLVLEITTDGAIEPEDAVKQAAVILRDHFNHFVNPSFDEEAKPSTSFDSQSLTDKTDETTSISIDELDLPVRVINALKRAEIYTLFDLSKMNKQDLYSIKNLGKKSVDMLIKNLKKFKIEIT